MWGLCVPAPAGCVAAGNPKYHQCWTELRQFVFYLWGTVNLFAVTLRRLGIEVRFATPDMTEEQVEALFDDNTRAVFGETIANPALTVLDIRHYAELAHRHQVPLLIDNTFATPVLCRPFTFGADIVIHSTTKYMDGHGTVVGGVIVDSGNFDWAEAGKYPELTTPDESYHGVIYSQQFGRAAYITKARMQLMRDIGAAPQPLAAFLLDHGLETLALRMERHSSNGLQFAEYLQQHPKVDWVEYPGLSSSSQYTLAKQYLPKGASGVVVLGVKGGRSAAMKFMDSLKMAQILVHVATASTCVLHPASTTHRQLTDGQLVAAGIRPEMVRFSVGLEHIDNIIADAEQALAQI